MTVVNKSVVGSIISCAIAASVALWIRIVFNRQFISPWVSDEPSLFNYAVRVMNELYYGTDGVYWPPGYIFFMGFIFKLFGKPDIPDIVIVSVVQSVIAALTAMIIVLIAYKMFRNIYVGLAAGLLYAIYPPAILYTGRFLSETLWVFWTMLAILLAYISVEKQRWYWFMLTGVALGIATLTRQVALPLGILVGMLIFLYNLKIKNTPASMLVSKADIVAVDIEASVIEKFKKAIIPTIIVFISMIVTIMPWTIRNYVVVGEFVFIDVNAGINLYLAHNEKSNGYWVDMGPNDPILQLRDHPDVDKEGKKRAYKYIMDNPKHTLEKAMFVHLLFWTKENADVELYGLNWLKELYQVYSFRLLAILGLLGVILSWRYWRVTLWLITFMIAYNLLIDFLYYSPRYRFVITPFLMLFAAYTIVYIIGIIQKVFNSLLRC